MSIKIMSEIWDAELPSVPAQRLVLLSLGDQANDDARECWPSVALICRRTALSRRCVQGSLRRLEAAGFIVTKPGGLFSGDKRASVYRIQPRQGGANGAQGGANGARGGANGARGGRKRRRRRAHQMRPNRQ